MLPAGNNSSEVGRPGRKKPWSGAWCEDHAIATDLAYRWDGVHYYRPGAKLVFDTIAPTLATLP